MERQRTDKAMTERLTPGPYKIVAATSFGVFLSALDSSIVNVSLVTMADFFNTDLLQIQWVVLSYLLVLTSAMPIMGKLGDRLGKTLVFQTGMLLFIFGSLSCALSPTLILLIVSRVFQAGGASLMTANGLALVTYFTTPQNRGRAIGMNSIVLATALGSGPVLGGILTQYYGWSSIFLINIPIGIIGLFVVHSVVPNTERVRETRFDSVGASLFFATLFSLVYGVTRSSQVPANETLFYFVLSFLFLLALLRRESNFVSPMIPTRVLADRRIATGFSSAVFSFMASTPVTLLIPFLFHDALGIDQVTTGLFLLMHPLTMSMMGPAAGFISEHVDARLQSVVGLSLQLVGLVIIAMVTPQLLFMCMGVAVMAAGTSLFSVSNGNFIMTSAPREYMGVVSALTNISRTVGFSVGTALATTVFTIYFMDLSQHLPYIETYIEAFRGSVLSFCLLVVIGAILSAFRGLSPAEIQRSSVSRTGDVNS